MRVLATLLALVEAARVSLRRAHAGVPLVSLRRALAGALLALAVCAPTAGAHATIVRTTPADTAVLPAQPRVVTMRWSESVELGNGAVRLLDASGKELDTADPARVRGDAATAALTLPGGLARGTYVVAWRVTSADSHPVTGAFSFAVGEPSAVVTADEGGTSQVYEVLDAIARGVAFLGFALATGGALVLLALWPEGPASRRGRRFVWLGVGLLAGGTFAVLLLQGPYATGSFALGFTLSTSFGHSLLARLALTAAFAALVAAALRRAAEPRERQLDALEGPQVDVRVAEGAAGLSGPARPFTLGAAACAVALLFTWTLTDHSRTGVQAWLGVPAATVHLLAMALWFGGLALLLVVVLKRPEASLTAVLPRFSRVALACFGVLGLTGVYLAWRQSGALAALPSTDFGKLLLAKSALVLLVIGLAALSRKAVARMGGDVARRLRRTVVAEVVLGVIVLGVTATLVNAEPARVAYAPPLDVTAPGPDGGEVQLHMEPAKQGENVVDIYLVARGGGLIVPPEVTARLLPPEGEDLGPLPVELASAEPGHYVASRLTVPFPGRWTLALDVRTSDIDEDIVRLPLQVR
jgi:copper transport protein